MGLPTREKLANHFLQLGWRSVAIILEIRIGTGTVSKAFEISIAAIMDRGAGFLPLRPCRISWDRLVNRVAVEWPDRKPCWVGLKGKAGVITASTRRSMILQMLERRDIGL